LRRENQVWYLKPLQKLSAAEKMEKMEKLCLPLASVAVGAISGNVAAAFFKIVP